MPQTPEAPLLGAATGSVAVGRYVLTVGSPAGTIALPARRGERSERRELAQALTAAGAAERIEEAVGAGEHAAGYVERAAQLTTALAEGRLDRETATREASALLGWLARFDREGRFRDVIRLAQALLALLALLGRWADLLRTVQLALRAAQTVGDRLAEAWAHHELGSFSLAGEQAHAATFHLETAAHMRHELGDEAGAQVSAHNLALARNPPPPPFPWRRVLAVAAGAAVLAAGIAVGIVLARDGDDDDVVTTLAPTTTGTTTDDDDDTTGEGPTTTEAPAPAAEITDGPSGLVNAREAAFAFTADGDAASFTCRLDDGDAEACESPHRYGDLADGEHLFTVFPTAPDGRAGEPAERAWTIDATAPTTTIESVAVGFTEATVAFLADETATFACRLDNAAPAPCTSPLTLTGLASDTGYTIGVVATDEAGNTGEEATETFETPSSVD